MLGLFSFFKDDHSNDNVTDTRIFIPLVAVYFLMCLSLLYSNNLGQGIHELVVQNGLISIPFIVWRHRVLFKKNVKKYLVFLTVSASLCALVTLIFYTLPIDSAKELSISLPIFQDYPDLKSKTQFGLYSPFIDRLHFAYILCFVLLIELHKIIQGVTRIRTLSILLILSTILLLGARGAQLGLLTALIPFGIFLLRAKFKLVGIRFYISAFVTCIIVLLVLPYLSYRMIPSVKSRYDQLTWEWRMIKSGDYVDYDYQHFTSLTRIRSIATAWKICKGHSLTGVGIGDTQDVLKAEYDMHGDQVPIHNQNYFLYLWMSSGFLAPLFFLIFVFYWLHRIWQNSNPVKKTLAISYLLFLLVILSIDAVLKYHIGVFSVPLFMAAILVVPENLE